MDAVANKLKKKGSSNMEYVYILSVFLLMTISLLIMVYISYVITTSKHQDKIILSYYYNNSELKEIHINNFPQLFIIFLIKNL